VQFTLEQVETILSVLDIKITHREGTKLNVSIPTNKSDVRREADVIEEILRIHGFNNVPVPPSMSFNPSDAPTNEQDFKETIANLLTGIGFTETMSLSLSESKKYMEIPDWFTEKDLVYIQNTSNIHLDIMRPEMLFSMLTSMSHNLNRQQSNLQFFEFGSIYFKSDDDLKESRRLGIGLTGDIWQESWQISKKWSPSSYHYLKAVVENIFTKSALTAFKYEEDNHPAYNFRLSFKKGRVIGHIGQVKESILKIFGIKQPILFASIDWDALLEFKPKKNVAYQPVIKFPSVRRDLALVVDNSVNFIDIELIANKVSKKILNSVNLFDVYKNDDQLGKGKKSYAVSFTFEDQEKTLKDQEIDRLMNKLINEFERQLNASIRR
jgi:phenylalanyl-tRNA synthetase beta chain